eukprot:CAMPEP_0197446090 /NCGR_PEP_ID=MMETSP1175-20131217/11135_1 /TAXON_ID=1003142 /ORGANISM="Triceratium dubium, Strain CCMP147" /LENGTH=303 /DNA_ID=CAMNT_0042977157 /DNA_START=92 /DNA_END=1000 /DNA_ORIENTATION=+
MLPMIILASGAICLVSADCTPNSALGHDVPILLNSSLVAEYHARICKRDYAHIGHTNPFRCASGDGYACCSDTEPIDTGMGLGECTPMVSIGGNEGSGEGKPSLCSNIPIYAQSCISECGGSFDQGCCNSLPLEVTQWIPQCNEPGNPSNYPGSTSTSKTRSLTKNTSNRLQKAIEIVPKFSAFLSFFGSGWIIFEVLSDSKKWRHMYHRTMLLMSIFDNANALMWFMSSWPQNPDKSPTSVYSAGNDITCNLQGFVWQFSGGTSPCNALLALYYLLLVRYNWSAQKIARKVERWFWVFIFVY